MLALSIHQAVKDSLVIEVNDQLLVRCRTEPERWALMPDVSNHLKTLNPDVPDFQPGKAWKNDSPVTLVADSAASPPGKENTNASEGDWNRGLGQRKKPTKKKVSRTNLDASDRCCP